MPDEPHSTKCKVTHRNASFVYRLAFQETILSVVAESYLALDPTPAAARAGAEALAGAVTSYSVRYKR